MSDKKCVFNLNENVAGALSYVLCFFSGIFFLVAERKNKFVRFHALQSTILFLGLCILNVILKWLPLIGGLLSGVVNIVIIVAWAFLIFMAFQGRTFKVPVIGDVVYEKINK